MSVLSTVRKALAAAPEGKASVAVTVHLDHLPLSEQLRLLAAMPLDSWGTGEAAAPTVGGAYWAEARGEGVDLTCLISRECYLLATPAPIRAERAERLRAELAELEAPSREELYAQAMGVLAACDRIERGAGEGEVQGA